MLQGKLTRRRVLAGAGAGVAALAAPAIAQSTRTVRFLHNETDPPSIAFYNAAIAAFEKQNPGVKIEMEVVSTDGRLQKVTAAMNARTMPEVFKILPEERFNFGRRGYLVQLDDVCDAIGRADFPANMLSPVDGKLYDLPYTVGNFSTMFYREDLLKAAGVAPPTTWAEYAAAAKALTHAPDTYGTVFPAAKTRMGSIFFASMLWSAGGTFFDKDLNLTFDSPAAVQALEFLKELAACSPPGIATYSYGEMVNTYLTGKVAIDIYAARVVANAATQTPALLPLTKTAPRPAGPSGIGVGFANPNSLAIASERVGARNTDIAKKFLAYIISGDRAVDFSLTAFPHLIPPLASVRSNARLLAGPPEMSGRQDLAQASFNIANTLDFETEAGATFAGGKVTASGVVNPRIGAIIARDIPAQVVQRAVLQGTPPAEAVKWGAGEMARIVADLRR